MRFCSAGKAQLLRVSPLSSSQKSRQQHISTLQPTPVRPLSLYYRSKVGSWLRSYSPIRLFTLVEAANTLCSREAPVGPSGSHSHPPIGELAPFESLFWYDTMVAAGVDQSVEISLLQERVLAMATYGMVLLEPLTAVDEPILGGSLISSESVQRSSDSRRYFCRLFLRYHPPPAFWTLHVLVRAPFLAAASSLL